MPDEYTARYEHLSHQQLYDMLTAGDPEGIEVTVLAWKTAEEEVAGLSDLLREDLGRLAPSWDSASGREYQRRLTEIVSFAGTLAWEFGSTHRGLSSMAEALRTAQRSAEHPDETDDHDRTVGGVAQGMAIGTVVAGPAGTVVGGVVGGFLGHDQDEQEKENARQRMLALVSGVAASYDTTGYSNWIPPETIPVDLPGSYDDTPVSLRRGPDVAEPATVDSTNTIGQPARIDLNDPDRVHTIDLVDGVAPGDPADPGGSSLAGAGGTGLTGVPGAGSGLAAGQLTGGVGGGAAGGSGLSGAPAGGVGGGAGAAGGVRAAGQSAAGPVRPGGRTAGGTGGGSRPAAAGTGRPGGTGKRKAGSGSAATAGPRATGGTRPGARTGDEEADDHSTWLTEDEMVWGGGTDAPPAVLGENPTERG